MKSLSCWKHNSYQTRRIWPNRCLKSPRNCARRENEWSHFFEGGNVAIRLSIPHFPAVCCILPEDSMNNDGAVVTPANTSRWEDLIDVYFSPGELFARRAHESWIKPFILLCAICIVLYYAFLPINAVLWDAMMVENAPPNADLEKMRAGAAMMKYLGGIMIPIGFGLS